MAAAPFKLYVQEVAPTPPSQLITKLVCVTELNVKLIGLVGAGNGGLQEGAGAPIKPEEPAAYSETTDAVFPFELRRLTLPSFKDRWSAKCPKYKVLDFNLFITEK